MANYKKNTTQASKKTAVEKTSKHFIVDDENTTVKETEDVDVVEESKNIEIPKKTPKKFQPGDMVICRCVRPNKVIFYSSKTDTRYEFGGYGDINEIDYSDLQKLKASKSPILFQPKILIEDEDLREQWARDLEEVSDEYDGIYNTDDLFDREPAEFERFIRNASNGVKELVKLSAARLIHEDKLTDLRIIRIIDDVLGTKYKEFI